MTSRIESAPSAPSPTAAIDRRETARTTALEVDWTKAAQAAFGSALFAGLIGGAVYVISKVMEADTHATTDQAPNDGAYTPFIYATSDDVDDDDLAEDAPGDEHEDDEAHAEVAPITVIDEKMAQAAAALGIAASASEDEVRAALRARLSSSRLHPDHGGDGEQAKRLIAAKNLLIERARAVRP
jgi:hypothetical protein